MKAIGMSWFIAACLGRDVLAAATQAERTVWRGTAAMIVVSAAFNPAFATTTLKAASDLPLSVKALYSRQCLPEYWIAGNRIMDGSSSDVFSDGKTFFLLVCGDGGSSTPFIVIAMDPQGEAHEAPVSWTIHGKAVGDAGMSNARFGPHPGTIVSHAHLSATCEPAYIHQWDGQTFQLISRKTTGCKPGDL